MSKSFQSGEWREPRGRRQTRRAADASAIIHSLMDFHHAEVLPTQSSHYRVPGAIGSVLIPEQLRLRYDQPAEGVGYTDQPTNVVAFPERTELPDDAA